MTKKKSSWLYVTLGGFVLLISFLFISISYQNKIHLSLPIYFFLLVICDLAATAFLSEALSSSAEYNGNILKGNLKLTGAAVIFFLILIMGYRYRPQETLPPFDLAIIVNGLTKTTPNSNNIIRIQLDNDVQEKTLDKDNIAFFKNIDPRFSGQSISISATIDGYKIANLNDTLVKIPDDPRPVIKLNAIPVIDSSLFAGYVVQQAQNKPFVPVLNAILYFNDLNRQIITDSVGHFRIFLIAKEGENSSLTVFKNNKWIFSDRVTLSKNMQILVHE